MHTLIFLVFWSYFQIFPNFSNKKSCTTFKFWQQSCQTKLDMFNYEPKLNWLKYRSQDHALHDGLVRFHAWIKLFTDCPPHFCGLSALQQLVIFVSVCFACNHISYFTFFLPFISFVLGPLVLVSTVCDWRRLSHWHYS